MRPPEDFLTLLRAWQRDDPDKVVITGYDVAGQRNGAQPLGRSTLTVAQLWRQVLAMGAALRRLGVAQGDVVAIQLPTWHEYFVAHLAAYAAGAVTMPISPIYRTRDVARQIELGTVKVLFVPAVFAGFDYIAMGRELRASGGSLRHVVAVGGTGEGALAWDDLLRDGAADPQARLVGEGRFVPPVDAFMLLNFTSGTTGVPKGVMHSVKTISAAIHGASDRMGVGAADVILIAVTIGHAAGFLNGVYMPLLRRARALYLDAWNPGIVLQVVERERATYAPMMPTFLFDLVRHERFAATDLSSLRRARVSGGAISRPVMSALQERLPDWQLFPGWGMSEGLYMTCGGPADPLDKRNQTDGRPLENVRLEIRDKTFSHCLPAGQRGEMVVKADSVMLGYYRQPELTAAAMTADGFLKTGDVGLIDEAGYLVMVGRSKDIVVRGGENVPIVEVENLLMEHPLVEIACVVGVPDERLGEKVCAVIRSRRPEEQLTLEEMRRFLIGRELTRQFMPELLVHFTELPLTSLGKVKRNELRQRVLDHLALPLPD